MTLGELLNAELLASALRLAVPVLLPALGGIFSERSGVINIGLEGMMIVGSFWAAYGALHGGPLAGIALAVLAGAALAAVHALVSVTVRADQIVSGVAINILAAGSSRLMCLLLFGMATTSPSVPGLPDVTIPLLARVPGLRPLVENVSPLVLAALASVPVVHWVLARTRFGLRLRAVGENPAAADSLGIPVAAMRYAGVILSGCFAGLAGAYLAMEHTGLYVEGATQGKGFIGLAAMIFGNWQPAGALVAALLFGFAEALSLRLVGLKAIPYQFVQMIPYVVTLLVLAGWVRHARPPAAVGRPYARGEA